VDVLLAITFYLCAGLALVGALAAALLPRASRWRAPGLFALSLGAAGAIACLSAGFAALVTLVCLTSAALLLSGRRASAQVAARLNETSWQAQLGGAAAAGLLLILVYAALRGDFVRGSYPGGWFGAAALGRVFFGRDAIALQAVAGAVMIGLGGLAGLAGTARSRRP
jgi:hypothetical protein